MYRPPPGLLPEKAVVKVNSGDLSLVSSNHQLQEQNAQMQKTLGSPKRRKKNLNGLPADAFSDDVDFNEDPMQ